MVASCAFCFAKFTPFLALFLGACFWIFERQICSLPPKFMLFYFCCGKFTSACAAALLWQIYGSFPHSAACTVLSSRSCSAHKRRFVCRLIMCFAWRNLYDVCRLCLFLAAYQFAMINKIFFSRIFHQACLCLIYRRLRKIYKVRILNLRLSSRAKF